MEAYRRHRRICLVRNATYFISHLIFPTDNEKPVISGCPSDQNVTTDIGNATAVVSWTPPTATDNSGNQTLTPSHNPGDYFPIGNNTVTYYASDDAGNTETCTFFVVVSGKCSCYALFSEKKFCIF